MIGPVNIHKVRPGKKGTLDTRQPATKSIRQFRGRDIEAARPRLQAKPPGNSMSEWLLEQVLAPFHSSQKWIGLAWLQFDKLCKSALVAIALAEQGAGDKASGGVATVR